MTASARSRGALRGLPLRELPQHLGVHTERELDRLEPCSKLLTTEPRSLPFHIGAPTSMSSNRTPAGWRWGRKSGRRHVLELHGFHRGCRAASRRHRSGCSVSRSAEHVDVVCLAVPEDVADLFAREHGGRRASATARTNCCNDECRQCLRHQSRWVAKETDKCRAHADIPRTQ